MVGRPADPHVHVEPLLTDVAPRRRCKAARRARPPGKEGTMEDSTPALSRLEHALSCARLGLRVFPLVGNKHTPAFKGWQEWATTDETKLRAKWAEGEYNIGIATGAGLVVLDVDVKSPPDVQAPVNGVISLEKLGVDIDDLDTFTVRTPTGGTHYYYLVDVHVSCSASMLGAGLDVRGVGGYVVGPGSYLPDGGEECAGGDLQDQS